MSTCNCPQGMNPSYSCPHVETTTRQAPSNRIEQETISYELSLAKKYNQFDTKDRLGDRRVANRRVLVEIIDQLQIELSQAREVRDIANIAAEIYRSRIVKLEEALRHDD